MSRSSSASRTMARLGPVSSGASVRGWRSCAAPRCRRAPRRRCAGTHGSLDRCSSRTVRPPARRRTPGHSACAARHSRRRLDREGSAGTGFGHPGGSPLRPAGPRCRVPPARRRGATVHPGRAHGVVGRRAEGTSALGVVDRDAERGQAVLGCRRPRARRLRVGRCARVPVCAAPVRAATAPVGAGQADGLSSGAVRGRAGSLPWAWRRPRGRPPGRP